jgi:hypothetical protein
VAVVRVSGDFKDSLAERCRDAAKVRLARLAPRGGLDHFGGERVGGAGVVLGATEVPVLDVGSVARREVWRAC